MKAFIVHVRVEPLNRRKKDLSYRKKYFGARLTSRNTWRSAVQGNREKRLTQETVKNVFRGTGHSDNNNSTAIVLYLCLRQKAFPKSFEACFSKRDHRLVTLPRHKPVLPLLIF